MKTRLFPLGIVLFFGATIISFTSFDDATDHSVTERLLGSEIRNSASIDEKTGGRNEEGLENKSDDIFIISK